MSSYALPRTFDDAWSLLGHEGSAVIAGGTDLLGRIDRGIVHPELVVDLRELRLDTIEPRGGSVVVGAGLTLAAVASAAALAPFDAIVKAASQAASPLLRNAATVGGNLLQGTRCWYYRGPEWRCWLGGGDTCYAQIGDHRKHGLETGDCISAHPSDLAPALAACGAEVVLRSRDGERRIALLDLYRRPTEENRSLVTIEPGEILTAIVLPPPGQSTYVRAGERQAFSFPLVAVAAGRREGSTRIVAAGVANTPRELDREDPLAGLPGNPQSAWKRDLLAELVRRALDELEVAA